MPPIKSPGKVVQAVPQPSSEEIQRRAIEAGSNMLLRRESHGNRLDWLFEGIARGVTDNVSTALLGKRTADQEESEQLERMRSLKSESQPGVNRWGEVQNEWGIEVELSETGSGRIKVFGVGESEFLKWLGYRLWSEEEVIAFYDNLNIRHPKVSTLKVCLSSGGSIEGEYPEKPFSPENALAIEKCGGRIIEEEVGKQ